MAITQTLTVTEVAGSVNKEKNTSKIRILWQSAQTADSGSEAQKTAKYFVCVNGALTATVSLAYVLPKETVHTIADRIMAVAHADDGRCTVMVRTWMDTDTDGVITQEQTVALTPITDASQITKAEDVVLGMPCQVSWVPKSRALRYRLRFAIGDWQRTTEAIEPNTTQEYTYKQFNIPLEAATAFPEDRSGQMTVTLITYADTGATVQSGPEDTAAFTVTVPEDGAMSPTASLRVSAYPALAENLDGKYLQGISAAQITATAEGRYGAEIRQIRVRANGWIYYPVNGVAFTTAELSASGSQSIQLEVTDSRGFTARVSFPIVVTAYSRPKLVPADDETAIVAARCDAEGNLDESGLYLKLKAKATFTAIYQALRPLNYGQIRYRYKRTEDGEFSEWTTVGQSGSGVCTVDSEPLLNGALSRTASYTIQVQAIDSVGKQVYTTIHIPISDVYWHRDGARRSFTFGGYVEEDNTFAIAEGIQFKIRGEKWVSLGLSAQVQESETSIGRAANTGCHYRVVNGNHVYVAFNCKASFADNVIAVSAEPIPAQYRPVRPVFALCATNYRGVARVYVGTDGNVMIDYVQDIASNQGTLAFAVDWIDGYIDYFV